MEIIIKNFKNDLPFNLGSITQFLGTDFYTKDKILNIIKRYFKKTKDSDESLEKDLYYKDEKMGKEFFEVINIDNKDDIIEKFKFAKTSLFKSYIVKLLGSYENQLSLNIIDDELMKIYGDINDIIKKEMNDLTLSYDFSDLISIVSNSEIVTEDEEDLYFMKNIDLIKNFISLICNLNENQTKRPLVIFNNIDHLINSNEYIEIANLIKEKNLSNVFFLFTISLDNFVYIDKDNLENIMIINQEIFNVPKYDMVRNYLKEGYPSFLIDDNIDTLLRLSLNSVGKEINKDIFKSVEVTHLFNKALMVNQEKINELNGRELEFLKI